MQLDILNLPIGENDAGATTVGDYLQSLLTTLWDEEEGFSGKRPFGNSGWKNPVYAAMIKAQVIKGKLDEWGYVESGDCWLADKLIKEVIICVLRHEP